MTATARRPGLDVTRTVALVGVVLMNYIGYLVTAAPPVGDDVIDRFLDPFEGPLATRFAATFTLVAGVGVTLFTERATGDAAAMSARRWILVRRGLVLYGGGLLLDMVWPGTILVYYGAMFVVGAVVCTWRTRWVVVTGVAAAVAGAAIAWWGLERRLDGHETGWLFAPGPDSPRGLVVDLFLNGTHPLLPWLAFFCGGIVLGRGLDRPGWQQRVVAIGTGLFAAATVIGAAIGDGDRADLTSTDPYSRSVVYTASTRSAPPSWPWVSSLGWPIATRARRPSAHPCRRRGDEPDALPRPRFRLPAPRRSARVGAAHGTGHRPDAQRTVLDRRRARRRDVAPSRRHRPGRVALPPSRRQTRSCTRPSPACRADVRQAGRGSRTTTCD